MLLDILLIFLISRVDDPPGNLPMAIFATLIQTTFPSISKEFQPVCVSLNRMDVYIISERYNFG